MRSRQPPPQQKTQAALARPARHPDPWESPGSAAPSPTSSPSSATSIVTLRIGSRLLIFISDRRLAPLPATRILSCNQHNITSAPYGSLWCVLRRNLMSETLYSSRVKLFASARQWVLHVLAAKLQVHTSDKSGAAVMESFQFAMFCLLILMCFGEKLDEESIRAIETTQRDLLLYSHQL